MPDNLEASGARPDPLDESVTSPAPRVLYVAVNYQSDRHAAALAREFLAGSSPMDQLIVADNSPEPSTMLQDLATAHPTNLGYRSYPSNPGYSGAARRVLSDMVAEQGPLEFDAVVLCNVDLSFDPAHVAAAIDEAHRHTGDHRWILGPNIVEADRRYRPNPQSLRRPGIFNGQRRHQVLRRSFTAFRAHRFLYRRRRRLVVNPNASRSSMSPMYAAYGAFLIFGVEYFTSGGVFHEAPLFAEEFGFAEQAHMLGVPVLFASNLEINHQAEVSTSAALVGQRRRYSWYLEADRFYRAWKPENVQGSMINWFRHRKDQAGLSD